MSGKTNLVSMVQEAAARLRCLLAVGENDVEEYDYKQISIHTASAIDRGWVRTRKFLYLVCYVEVGGESSFTCCPRL